MKSNLTEVLKLAVYYVVFNLVLLPASISLHEWGHWLAAYTLNYRSGYVVFTPAGGYFYPNEPLRSIMDGFIIGIAGGLTVATIFTILYFFLDWETDEIEKYVLRNYVIHQTVYAMFESLYGMGLINENILYIVSVIIYPICLYGSLIYLFLRHGVSDG
jgi:hypothetical protein